MFNSKLFLMLFFFLSKITYSQEIKFNEIDSLLSNYKNNNFTIVKSDFDFLKQKAFQIQNKAFLLQENESNFQNSLFLINKALDIWGTLKDTLNIANLKKYKGFLLANLNDFKSSKNEIRESIKLFLVKGNLAGVAVSNLDLSRSYYLENKLDSAVYFAFTSKRYWKNLSDTSRLVTINNQLLNIYLKMNNSLKAKEVFDESRVYLNKKDIHWRMLIDFNFLSCILFNKLNDSENESYYFNQYNSLIESLKTRNINTKSQYDL